MKNNIFNLYQTLQVQILLHWTEIIILMMITNFLICNPAFCVPPMELDDFTTYTIDTTDPIYNVYTYKGTKDDPNNVCTITIRKKPALAERLDTFDKNNLEKYYRLGKTYPYSYKEMRINPTTGCTEWITKELDRPPLISEEELKRLLRKRYYNNLQIVQAIPTHPSAPEIPNGANSELARIHTFISNQLQKMGQILDYANADINSVSDTTLMNTACNVLKNHGNIDTWVCKTENDLRDPTNQTNLSVSVIQHILQEGEDKIPEVQRRMLCHLATNIVMYNNANVADGLDQLPRFLNSNIYTDAYNMMTPNIKYVP